MLGLAFAALGIATIAAPELWEYYGILLTTPRAENQFVSVVGGGLLALSILCWIAAIKGRTDFNILIVATVILGLVSLVRLFAFFFYGGFGMKLGAEWAVEILGCALCYYVAKRSGLNDEATR